MVFWNCFDSLVFWNCSDSVVFSVFLLDFGIVPTVWYFGNAPTVRCFFAFLLDYGIVLTVWYIGIAPTVWHVLISVYYTNPTQSKFTFKYKCH